MKTLSPRRPTKIHLVPHTHWDREWYRPFQSFRMQLVDLVDRLLDMLDTDEEFAFTLDGQLATIDDYLEIRPEQEGRIGRHVASGGLAIGPWQILMDEFLVSGETLVRNLEAGWQRAEALGGPMRIGYLPDMFGHIAQMPQILRRAGIGDAVVWRGVPAAVTRHAFRWESPDGSWVRTEYLHAGYGNAAYLFAVPDRFEVAAQRLIDSSCAWFDGDSVLAMYGTDHAAPMPDVAALVRRLNAEDGGPSMRISTLPRYLDAMPALTDEAPCWRGELRSSARANVLMGVASARIDIKRAAGRAERLLERYAEPLHALHVAPEAWPERFLRLAWSKVIENSAHDSICGCSADAVVDQVLVRFGEAEQIGDSLTRIAAIAVAGTVSRDAVAVLNPTPAAREAVVVVELAVPDAWGGVAFELPDGSRVGTQELSRREPLLLEATVRGDGVDDIFRRFHGREVFGHYWNAYGIDGRTVTLEVDDDPEPLWLDVDHLRESVVRAMRAHPDESWTVRIVAQPRRSLAASIPAPALGWTVLRPVAGEGPVSHPVRVQPDGRTLTNGLVAISVAEDGTLRMESPEAGSVEGIGRIVDGGDAGDSYNYAPPATDALVREPTAVSVEAGPTGPVRASLAVSRTYRWPTGVLPDGRARSAATVPTTVVTAVELRAGEPFARVAVSFTNLADDHRVRFHVPLFHRADASHAEGQFAVVERGTVGEGGHGENPLPTFPAHGWVDAGGLAVLLDHVVEYELVEGGRELALTLLRSIGRISRNHNPYREDPAGPEIAIPGAQMRRPWRIEFGLFPHDGGWADGGVLEMAERYRHAFVTAPGTGAAEADTPFPGAGEDVLALEGRGVVMTSLRRRAEGWLEVRLVNLEPRSRTATLRGGLIAARDASLRGEAGGTLELGDGGALRLELGAAEIRTLQVRRRDTAVGRPGTLDAAAARPSAWPTR